MDKKKEKMRQEAPQAAPAAPEEQLARRQSAPQPTALEALQKLPAPAAGAMDGFRALAQVIGREQIHEARLTLQKYKEGKANLEQKVIEN